MFKFSDIVEIQGQSECVTEKNVSESDEKEMTENINDRSETVCFSWRFAEHAQNCVQ